MHTLAWSARRDRFTTLLLLPPPPLAHHHTATHTAACTSSHLDYLKCPHPKGWAVANMAFSMLEFKEAYTAAGQWDAALRIIKWGTDWLLKAHVKVSDDPAGNAFVGQVRPAAPGLCMRACELHMQQACPHAPGARRTAA